MGSWQALRAVGRAVTVILNNAALTALLETEIGPVGRFVQRTAEAVVVAAQLQFDEYFHGVLPAERDIDFSMRGSSAIIGYVGGEDKHKTARLAAAEAGNQLSDPPLTKALDTVRANGGR